MPAALLARRPFAAADARALIQPAADGAAALAGDAIFATTTAITVTGGGPAARMLPVLAAAARTLVSSFVWAVPIADID